jgi:hypothetical protein
MIHETRFFPLSSLKCANRHATALSGDAVEPFHHTGPQTLEYSATVNDPRTCQAPWTARFPPNSEPGYEMFEYTCHEGNYAMRN